MEVFFLEIKTNKQNKTTTIKKELILETLYHRKENKKPVAGYEHNIQKEIGEIKANTPG